LEELFSKKKLPKIFLYPLVQQIGIAFFEIFFLIVPFSSTNWNSFFRKKNFKNFLYPLVQQIGRAFLECIFSQASKQTNKANLVDGGQIACM
jgi:hypothetical protein